MWAFGTDRQTSSMLREGPEPGAMGWALHDGAIPTLIGCSGRKGETTEESGSSKAHTDSH